MLSPGLEYAQNVERTCAPRDRRDFAAITVLTIVLALVHASSRELADATIFALLAVAAALCVIRAQLICGAPREPPIAPVLTGYRDAIAPLEMSAPHVSPRWVFNATRVVCVAMIYAARDGLGPWCAIAIGVAIVVSMQRLHAAWKKRHDAKLMLEWERRLEEKG